MRLRPGRTLGWLGGAGALLSIGCFMLPVLAWLLVPVFAAAGVLLLLEYAELRRALPQCELLRTLPESAGRGIPFSYALALTNGARRSALFDLRPELPEGAQPGFWSEPFHLMPGETRSIVLEIVISRRGLHSFGPVWLRLHGRFGLVEAQTHCLEPAAIKILPEALVEKKGLSHRKGEEVQLNKLVRTHLQGEGTEFQSLSEYREGDDPRRVDWRASARHGHLITRRYQIEQHRDVLVLIDCGRLMGADIGGTTKLDQAVNATLMLGRAALVNGDRFGVGIFDSKVRGFLPPQAEIGSFRRIREAIADLASRVLETNFGEMFGLVQLRQRKRALVVVISDLPDAETTARFRIALAALCKRHVVLFIAMRTPQFQTLLREPVREVRDAARAAVVFRLLREREKALHDVTRSGVHVLDLEPREVTVPLVQRYVDLREQNLL